MLESLRPLKRKAGSTAPLAVRRRVEWRAAAGGRGDTAHCHTAPLLPPSATAGLRLVPHCPTAHCPKIRGILTHLRRPLDQGNLKARRGKHPWTDSAL